MFLLPNFRGRVQRRPRGPYSWPPPLPHSAGGRAWRPLALCLWLAGGSVYSAYSCVCLKWRMTNRQEEYFGGTSSQKETWRSGMANTWTIIKYIFPSQAACFDHREQAYCVPLEKQVGRSNGCSFVTPATPSCPSQTVVRQSTLIAQDLRGEVPVHRLWRKELSHRLRGSRCPCWAKTSWCGYLETPTLLQVTSPPAL